MELRRRGVRRSTLPHSDFIKYEVVRTYTGRVPEVSGRRRGMGVAGVRQISGAITLFSKTCLPLCVCASVRLGAQVLFPIHLHEFEEVAERQRPDQQSQDPEIRYAGERTDEGDEGVNVRPAPEHHRSQDVVDIPDEEADQCDERGGGLEGAAEERDGRRHPDERSEEHTSELQPPCNLVCRLLLEKKKEREVCDAVVPTAR